eukprot:2090228-Rhodomonas_salina.1
MGGRCEGGTTITGVDCGIAIRCHQYCEALVGYSRDLGGRANGTGPENAGPQVWGSDARVGCRLGRGKSEEEEQGAGSRR